MAIGSLWRFDSAENAFPRRKLGKPCNHTSFFFFYLSGAGVDILRPALVPVGQQLNGGRRRAEPQQLGSVLVQEAVIIEQVLVQHSSEEDIEGERRVCHLFTRAEQ